MNKIQEGFIFFRDKHVITESDDEITFFVSGDFAPVNRLKNHCNDKNVLSDIYDIISKSDLAITNLEVPLTSHNNPIKKVGPHLKADPSCISLLTTNNINIVTLANNHIMDYGEKGLIETIDICKQNNILTVGAGKNLYEASKPLYLNKNKNKIAIVNFTHTEFSSAKKDTPGANPLDPIANHNCIKEAKGNSDYLIVIIHAGNEHYSLPSPKLKKIFRYFIDIGADAVIGHHTHCASGIEIYREKPIIYSLGNFLFDWPEESFSDWFYSYFVKLSVKNKRLSKLEIFPYKQCKDFVGLKLLSGNEKNNFIDKISTLSDIILDDDLLKENWEKFTSSLKYDYLSAITNSNRIQRFLLKKKLRSLPEKYLLTLLNLTRCEAHNEILTTILENIIKKGDSN